MFENITLFPPQNIDLKRRFKTFSKLQIIPRRQKKSCHKTFKMNHVL